MFLCAVLESGITLGAAWSWGLPCQLNSRSNPFSKMNIAPSRTELFQFSFQDSITTFQGFPKRYLCNSAKSAKKFVLCSKSNIFLILQTLTICYFYASRKALKSGNWILKWEWEKLCSGRCYVHFTESITFSVKWAWQPPWQCHTQSHSWF